MEGKSCASNKVVWWV